MGVCVRGGGVCPQGGAKDHVLSVPPNYFLRELKMELARKLRMSEVIVMIMNKGNRIFLYKGFLGWDLRHLWHIRIT